MTIHDEVFLTLHQYALVRQITPPTIGSTTTPPATRFALLAADEVVVVVVVEDRVAAAAVAAPATPTLTGTSTGT